MNTGSISVGTTKLRINQKIDIGDTMQYLTGIDTKNIKDTGFYFVESCTSCPGDGFLEVYKGYNAFILQRFTLRTNGQVSERIFSTGYWGDWLEQLKLDSPALTGTPTTPTPTSGGTGKQIVNLDFVNSMLGGNTVPAKNLATNIS